MAWVYSDERTSAVEHVLHVVIQSGGWVPVIWRLEVANALQQGIRQRRIDANLRDQAIADLAALNIATDAETNRFAWNETLTLADRFRLTLYDACYLELAQRRELPLATLDRELRAAGRTLGLELLGG